MVIKLNPRDYKDRLSEEQRERFEDCMSCPDFGYCDMQVDASDDYIIRIIKAPKRCGRD